MQMITHGEANLILQLWIKCIAFGKSLNVFLLTSLQVEYSTCHAFTFDGTNPSRTSKSCWSLWVTRMQWYNGRCNLGIQMGLMGYLLDLKMHEATRRWGWSRPEVMYTLSQVFLENRSPRTRESLRCFVGRTDTDPYPNALCIFANVLHRSCVILLIGLAWCSMKTSKLGLGVIMVKMWKWLAWKAGKKTQPFFVIWSCDFPRPWWGQADAFPTRLGGMSPGDQVT